MNFLVINAHNSHYTMPSASCIHGSHAVDVAAYHGKSISWYPSHGVRSTLQWSYCSLASDASHVTWSDQQHSYVTQFRNLMPSLRARRAAEMGYTLQYCSQDNSRVSTDRWSLTRYMHSPVAELLTAHSKHFAPHDLRLWLRWPSGDNYSYSANFWLHYSAEYE